MLRSWLKVSGMGSGTDTLSPLPPCRPQWLPRPHAQPLPWPRVLGGWQQGSPDLITRCCCVTVCAELSCSSSLPALQLSPLSEWVSWNDREGVRGERTSLVLANRETEGKTTAPRSRASHWGRACGLSQFQKQRMCLVWFWIFFFFFFGLFTSPSS